MEHALREWDGVKSSRNLAKHRISFETASLVFEDPHLLVREDRVVVGEERWQAVGLIGGAVIVLVAHTHREEDGEEVVRIISARKAEASDGKHMKKLTKNQAKEIRALKRMKDDEIDFTDIPPTRDWSNVVVGKPTKKSLTIRLNSRKRA